MYVYRVSQKYIYTGCPKNICIQGVPKIYVYRVSQKYMYTGCPKNICIQGVPKIYVYRVSQKYMYTGCPKNICIQGVPKIYVYRVSQKYMYTVIIKRTVSVQKDRPNCHKYRVPIKYLLVTNPSEAVHVSTCPYTGESNTQDTNDF